jgi:hypothetical protein
MKIKDADDNYIALQLNIGDLFLNSPYPTSPNLSCTDILNQGLESNEGFEDCKNIFFYYGGLLREKHNRQDAGKWNPDNFQIAPSNGPL